MYRVTELVENGLDSKKTKEAGRQEYDSVEASDFACEMMDGDCKVPASLCTSETRAWRRIEGFTSIMTSLLKPISFIWVRCCPSVQRAAWCVFLASPGSNLGLASRL